MGEVQDLHALMQPFNSVTWCAKLLTDPSTVLFVPTCRLQGDAATKARTQDQLFRRTLLQDDAVPHCVGFYTDRNPALSSVEKIQHVHGAPSQSGPSLFLHVVSLLFDLRSGVAGFNGTVHGGLIASIIDEAMGSFILVNHQYQTRYQQTHERLPDDILDLDNRRVFTAGMDVKLQKPIPLPAIVHVTVDLSRIDGRKIYLDVKVKSKDAVQHASCDGLWLSLPLESV